MIERVFRTAKDMIYATANKDWVVAVPVVEMALRSSIHETTKVSLYEVLFGRKMSTPFTKLGNTVTIYSTEYVKQIKKTIEEVHDKIRKKVKIYEHGVERGFKVGEKVYVRILPIQKGIDKPNYEGPYVIIKVKGTWCYRLKHCHTGRIIERNYYHIKRCENMTPSLVKHVDTRRETSVQSVSATSVAPATTAAMTPQLRYPRRQRLPPNRLGFPDM